MSAGTHTPTDLDRPIGALKTQLSKLLLSFDRIGWEKNSTSGRFDMRRVNRMMAGAERVFRKRTEDKAVKTVVSIVVDLSASMNSTPHPDFSVLDRNAPDWWEKRNALYSEAIMNSNIRNAARAAWALAQCVERVGCEVEVMGFRSGADDMSLSGLDSADGSEFESSFYRGYQFGKAIAIKQFHQKLSSQRETFEYMHSLVGGCTPDYHVVRTLAERVAAIPAQRRIVMVLTDGVGDDELMKAFCNYSEKSMGTMVLGVGIGTNKHSMESSYNRYALINKVEELGSGAIASLIKQVKSLEKK